MLSNSGITIKLSIYRNCNLIQNVLCTIGTFDILPISCCVVVNTLYAHIAFYRQVSEARRHFPLNAPRIM